MKARIVHVSANGGRTWCGLSAGSRRVLGGAADVTGEKEFCRECSAKWEELNGQRAKPTPA
jgi:hypothetical protein